MEVNEDSKTAAKNKNKWNIFQRGPRNKSAAFEEVYQDPAELQRVSFATNINDLPARPSAFQQVLNQVRNNSTNSNSSSKMNRLHKKLSKDNRSSQNNSGGTSSPVPRISEQLIRPRSHSNASQSSVTTNPELSFPPDSKESEQPSVPVVGDSAVTNSGKMTPPVFTSEPAGALLMAADSLPFSNLPGNESTTHFDTVDGVFTTDAARNRQLAETLKQKIMKTSETFKTEQAIKEENVSEYLELAENADKQQIGRIKAVFERKNAKSKATLAQLQKKLDNYHKKLKELENGSGKQNILRDVGANLRDFSGGVVGSVKGGLQHATGAIVNKPKEMASKLKNRFGSSDNISNLKDPDDNKCKEDLEGIGDDRSSNSGSDFCHQDDVLHLVVPESPNASLRRRDAQQIALITQEFSYIKTQLQDVRASQEKLEQNWEKKKDHLRSFFSQQLSEARVRYDDQLNDLNEFHRREMNFIKQELISLEDKMKYNALEKARDMQETLESCQTRITKMELQQQQSVSVEGLENANARALLGKLINLLLSVMTVLLVLVSALSGFLMPFIKSQGRVFVTVVVIVLSVLVYRHWDAISVIWTTR